MKIVRLGIWGIILILFALLASIPVVWATPEQSSLNQTLPPATAVATAVIGTPTATPIPLLPPSGDGTPGNGFLFFILTGSFLIGGTLALLLNVRRRGSPIDRPIH